MAGRVKGSDGDGSDADTLTTKLLDEFRSRIDEPLILTIASDYDLQVSFTEARQSLLLIAENVVAEEASGFNSSGLPYENPAAALDALNLDSDTVHTVTDSSKARTSDSERTSLLDVTSERSDSRDEGYQTLDTKTWTHEDKTAELRLCFPDLSEFDVSYSLKKAAGDLNKAYDELLNIQYLEDIGERPKGVDAFFISDEEVLSKKKKRANKKVPKAIQKRVDLGYDLAPPKLESIEAEPDTTTVTPSRGARLLTSRGSDPQGSIPSTKPPINPDGWNVVATKKPKPQPHTNPFSPLSPTSPQPPSSRAAPSHREQAHSAYEAAGLATRRGRSDPLLRPYAGILAERGHEHMRAARRQDRAHWEALVESQSSLDVVDLHGAPVQDGVRIALRAAQAWWDSFGEDRARLARRQHLTIITGTGYHSAGGVSRMRSEVGAALDRYGWKNAVETGQFIVTGRKSG